MKRFLAVLFCVFIALSVVTAEVTSISLSKDHLSSNESERSVTVTVKGMGFKSLKALHVQLSQDGKSQSPVQCNINATGTEGTAVINVPAVEGINNSGTSFIVRAIENYTSISSVTATIQITAPATISKISVTDYSVGDTALSLRLNGHNLDIRGETVIQVIDSDGKEAVECRTTLLPPVVEAEEEPVVRQEFDIGDIVLKDGTIVPIDDYNKRRMGIPTGIIAFERDGYPYMVGVQSIANANSGNGMRWCSYSAEGYRRISELESWSSEDYIEYGVEIKGFTDGSEAWNIILDYDSNFTADPYARDYYPAFWYAENYGINNNLSGTKYETGWFVPSLWELVEIYRNSDIINDSFSEFCNYDLGYRRYRSSSQNPEDSGYSPGVNFDGGYIWDTYSSKDESDVYVMVVCPVYGGSGNKTTSLETLIPVPNDSGIFTIQVLIDGVLQPANGRIQIAGEPEITRVDMPDVSVDYCGEEIQVIIYGKNFTVDGMDASKFIVFGMEASQVRIINDTQASVTITYPDRAGNYEVTFVCGESMFAKQFHILNSVTSTWAPGDVILSDGSRVDAANVSKMTDAQKANAVAVVAFTKYGLVPYGMGLVQNEFINLMKEYSTGYNTMITAICSDRENSWYADGNVTVTGDTNGYDNWAVVQTLDPNGAKNAAINYPGFNWAQNYGISHGLPGTCSDGWYVPALAELVQVYRNREAINKSLQLLGRSTILRGWFSTSSQDPGDSDYIWRVDFSDGEIDTYWKDTERYLLVIRQFDSTVATQPSSGTTSLRRN